MLRKRNADSIFNNKTSGSVDLVFQLNKYMEKNSGNIELLEKTIPELKKYGAIFQAVEYYLKELHQIIKTGDPSKLKVFFKSFGKNQTRRYKMIYESSRHLLENKKRVLTVSNSRTVLEFLKLWHLDNKKLEVVIPESRPMNEGRELAKSLLKEGIKIIYITDFNTANYISTSDAVITGADSILRNGDVVNKTGSRAAAIIAGYFKKPFYVLAGPEKYSKKNFYNPQTENSNEVWDFKKKKLKIINNYFEVVEKKLITKIIPEKNR